MANGTADEALLTVLVMFNKMSCWLKVVNLVLQNDSKIQGIEFAC